MKANLRDFDETCELSTPYALFYHVYIATKGDPCTTGCAFFEGGNCICYKKLIKMAVVYSKTDPVITNKQIAGILNCSKREVSRMRKNGILPSEFK